MKYYIFLFTLVICLSCQQASQQTAADSSTNSDNELPEGFSAFYTQFHADSAFQVEHIQFPLQTSRKDGTTVKHSAAEWVIQRPIDPKSGYVSIFTSLTNELVMEEIINPKDKTGLVRRFLRDGDSWKLIYYQGVSNLKE